MGVHDPFIRGLYERSTCGIMSPVGLKEENHLYMCSRGNCGVMNQEFHLN